MCLVVDEAVPVLSPLVVFLAAAVVLDVYGKRFPNTITSQEASKLYQAPIR
jgi:hypothetical protein